MGRRADRDRRLDPRPPGARPPGVRGVEAAGRHAATRPAPRSRWARRAWRRRSRPCWPGSGDGPTIAVLAEYDALPKLGHGCGHNLIATSALGAGLALDRGARRAGRLDLGARHAGRGERGAERGRQGPHGQRRHLRRRRRGDHVPPGHRDGDDRRTARWRRAASSSTSTARPPTPPARPKRASTPSTRSSRCTTPSACCGSRCSSDVRIHGIILAGGAAANIIPDYAAIRYRTRSDDADYLEEVVQRVVGCAEGAARRLAAAWSGPSTCRPTRTPCPTRCCWT